MAEWSVLIHSKRVGPDIAAAGDRDAGMRWGGKWIAVKKPTRPHLSLRLRLHLPGNSPEKMSFSGHSVSSSCQFTPPLLTTFTLHQAPQTGRTNTVEQGWLVLSLGPPRVGHGSEQRCHQPSVTLVSTPLVVPSYLMLKPKVRWAPSKFWRIGWLLGGPGLIAVNESICVNGQGLWRGSHPWPVEPPNPTIHGRTVRPPFTRPTTSYLGRT